MRPIFTYTVLILFALPIHINAQNLVNSYGKSFGVKRHPIPANQSLDGQWRGTFTEDENGSPLAQDSIVYVLELKVDNNNISGSSYTYFYEGDKRYYTICRVIGNVNRANNSVVVTEVERTGHNTPPWWSNCFQIHRLYFDKGAGSTEYLKGDWIPAPGQHCMAVGTSVLSKRVVNRRPFAVKQPSKKPSVAQHRRAPVEKKNVAPKPQPQKEVKKEVAKAEAPATKVETSKIPSEDRQIALSPSITKSPRERVPKMHKGYERRKNVVVQNIDLKNDVFQVDFYDNGIIDGDSISVFYNDKLILSRQMLTDRPITLTLSYDKDLPQNTITMYAENLGSIPPNTALMIVRDGNKRYEVRMESDLSKSSSVTFSR